MGIPFFLTSRLSGARIAGFSCYQGFIYAVFYMGMNRALSWGSASLERADLLSTLLAAVAVFALLEMRPALSRRLVESEAALAVCAFMLTAGAFLAEGPASAFFGGVVIEGVLVGAPMAVLLMAWGRVLGHVSPRAAACEIFVSTGCAAAVCFAASFFGPQSSAVLSAVLPAASTGLLLTCAPEHRGKALASECDEAAPSSSSSRARLLSRRMLVGAGMFGLAAGLMETFRSHPGASSAPGFPATLFILALFCLAVLQSLKAKSDEGGGGPLAGVYRIVMALMLAGFLFTPALYGSGIPGEAVVLAACLGLTAVFVALFIAVAALRGIDSASTFCRGFCALYLGEALGIAAGNGLDALGPSDPVQHAMLAVAGLAAVVAYLFLFTESDFEELSVIVDAADTVDIMHAAIVAAAKLSPRESEVLALALRGRTNERIAQELVVAKSTVDTHLRRIYGKAGVHSRQELIDFGECLAKGKKSR